MHWKRIGARALLISGLVVLASAATATPAAPADAPMEKSLSFRVLIDADGKLVSATPLATDLGGAILRSAIGLAKSLSIRPAQAEGVPATAETILSVTVQLHRQPDDSYKLGLKSASLATEPLKRTPPQYRWLPGKNRQQASGLVVLALVVRADGSVDTSQTRVLQSAVTEGGEAELAKMAQAASKALAHWTYQPDRVAGQPVSTMTTQLIRFCAPGPGDCEQLPTPAPTAEMLTLPRAMTPERSLPVLLPGA
jgi:hypothetical protein